MRDGGGICDDTAGNLGTEWCRGKSEDDMEME